MSKGNGETRARILEVHARDVKCVREVNIDFEGNIHEIAGDSGQGKTTILDVIEAGIRGLDPKMVRRGANKAEIEIVLDCARIKRITPADPAERESLMVSDANGKGIDKAKDFLRALMGPTAFRPLEWVQLGAGEERGKTERLRKQRDMLLSAISMPLDAKRVGKAVRALGKEYAEALAEVDLDNVEFEQHGLIVCGAIERACYDYRALQNRLVDRAVSKLEVTPKPKGTIPDEDIETLEARLEEAAGQWHRARGKTSGREKLTQQIAALREMVAADEAELPAQKKVDKTRTVYAGQAESLRTEIAELEASLRTKREELGKAEEALAQCDVLSRRIAAHEGRKADLASMEAELEADTGVADLGALQAAMEEAKADLENQRAANEYREALKEAEDARRRSELFDGLVKLFRDDLPKALLAECDLPVEGLGIDGDTVTIGGVPVHQLGTSQQIRVGVLVAAALNPRSGFVLIDGAESMGKKDLAALAKEAGKLGLQLIMTRVDDEAAPGPGRTVMREGAAVT